MYYTTEAHKQALQNELLLASFGLVLVELCRDKAGELCTLGLGRGWVGVGVGTCNHCIIAT